MTNPAFAPLQRVLTGTSVLVVEDDATIGACLEELLWDAGCIVLGPVSTVNDALALLQKQRPDVALLDYMLGDREAALVASALRASGVPFALLTGAHDLELTDGLSFTPRVTKPFGSDAVQQMLRDLLDRSHDLDQQLEPTRD